MSRDDPGPSDRVVLVTAAFVLGTCCLLVVAFAPGLVPDGSTSSDADERDDTPIVVDRNDTGAVDGDEMAVTEPTAADEETSGETTDSDSVAGPGSDSGESSPRGDPESADGDGGPPDHEDDSPDNASEPGPPDHAGPPSDGERGPPDHAGPG
ncbi:hypothetical protein [Halosolutus halophilus]|uniref:hypothetical protein n=1 Tax=Halosolutus halophilus TaxID=1552990 RepID=UPI00223504C1|nr:hypothetical protein [Halosolutus halophilus]